MKKNLINILIALFCSSTVFGQNGNQQIDTLSTKVGRNNLKSYLSSSNSEGITIEIDKNNDLIFTKIIENLNMNSDEIYKKAFSFFVYNYRDAKSVIQQQDKEAGLIIGKGYYSDFHCSIGTYKMMGADVTTYDYYSCFHLLRIDIKDNRVRLILSVSNYEVRRSAKASNFVSSSSSNSNGITYKKIIDSAPIDTASIETRTSRALAINKSTGKLEKKLTGIMVKNEMESEKDAFLPLCNRAITSLLELEKVLKEGNHSTENKDW